MSDVLLRLRPIAHATPTPTGLHVRGWKSSFSLDGGTGLWTIWERLAGPLADGVPPDQLTVPDGAPPAVAKALTMIIEQLHEHDLLVEVPADWGGDAPPADIASWLESVAPDPATAWRRLRATPVTVAGEGALAAAAHRALTAAGLTAERSAGDDLLLTAGPHAVAAGCAADVGFVVAPGAAADVRADATAVAARLSGAPGTPPEVLAALVGSAAAHRLVCVLGGLPDPSTEAVNMWQDAPPSDPPHQPVLVARLDPLSAEYHPWLSAARPQAPGGNLLDVLGDRELGPVPTPEPGDLPQLPVKLAASGDVVGYGTTEHAARLDALLRAVQRLAPPGAVVGADRDHALGLALRHAARRLGGTPVAEDEWLTDPTARRWWQTLVLRFALPATAVVTRLAEGVVRASVLVDGVEVAWAVEAGAADALSFAALAAAGRAQAGRAEAVVLSGALPLPAPEGPQAPWVTRDWTWPSAVRDAEPGLRDRLRELVGDAEPVALGPVLDAAGVVAFAVPEVAR
ncbi:hypothetical protein [Saccharothrix obliqua]|uniref:hypothetical protein n=1 Tax=Saccharothrix obliqua TaxID=2861747 RepID=UPI001C5E5838|nr:hypothetical protein [Saccharothrix obliqua]MBW4717786.1 hypothetical protein [Saccharothrix obliqua]